MIQNAKYKSMKNQLVDLLCQNLLHFKNVFKTCFSISGYENIGKHKKIYLIELTIYFLLF